MKLRTLHMLPNLGHYICYQLLKQRSASSITAYVGKDKIYIDTYSKGHILMTRFYVH